MKLPSRYEDLDTAFRGRLLPVPELIAAIQKAKAAMQIAGGLRFLPIYGESGSGKSSAARELSTHLPESETVELPRNAIESFEELKIFLLNILKRTEKPKLLNIIIDQYEEVAASATDIPTQFIERLSLLDRDSTFTSLPMIFIWLTTKKEFQQNLVAATSRNKRILIDGNFELKGVEKSKWAEIIEETFEFHNDSKELADFGIVRPDIQKACDSTSTIGSAIEEIVVLLSEEIPKLQDLSKYKVIMLWPVTDGQRIGTILRFVDARDGYKLDWNAWYKQLNEDDRKQLPLAAYNRARLYFDVRLVPIAAADLHPLCKKLDDKLATLHQTYLDRFKLTHYVSILMNDWDPTKYSPLRERDSVRADKARTWYHTVTSQPTKIGRRLAAILCKLGIESTHEKDYTSTTATVRADVGSQRPNSDIVVITELKAFSAENTMPSTIRDAIKTTLKRHAQFAGFLPRQ